MVKVNQDCSAKIEVPTNTQELLAIIEKAKKEKVALHAYGSNYSWKNIICVDGYLINTDKLNKIVSTDLSKNQVTVQAGIKLYDLYKELASLGLCLSNQSFFNKPSLAGVVATAAHGSGKTGTIASFITNVQLATADAALINVSATENSDLFDAVRTSIGALGVMTALTIQCEPLFKLKREYKKTDWQTILKDYKKLLNDNDYMQFYWKAADDSVEVTIHNKVMSEHEEKQSDVGYSYEMLSGELNGLSQKHIAKEIAIPMKNFVEASSLALKLVRENYKQDPMIEGILFRFVTEEKHNLLSLAADRDIVCFNIATLSTMNYEKFYKEFYDLMFPYGGRPHWATINYLTYNDTRTLYGQNFDNFIAIRKKLDLHGLFSNEFTQRIFGW